MSNAWPYDEARRIRLRENVVFETGYGPSGLPHIGTFTEVLRTAMVQRAFEEQTGVPSRLIVFSDDMDALRRAPDNVPQIDMLEQHIGVPLSSVPDPFGTHESFAHHNNAHLRDFLDRFGFEYEFMSSTELYRSGFFDVTLRRILDNYETVRDIILPTLGEDRRATYCPFMPIINGRVIDSGYISHDANMGTITFDIDGEHVTVPVTGGHCKLQWKVDWAMRWIALGVSYEMAGKDLIDSVVLSGRIVRALGFEPPVGFNYEMFLDAEGRKISKSLGNGLSIEEWLTYGPPESLAFFLYREPRRAKSLHANLVRMVDEYWDARRRYPGQTEDQRRGNPVHHVHAGTVPVGEMPVSFAMLLNLIGILGETDEEIVWNYLRGNYAGVTEAVRELIPYALAYHRDHLAALIVRRAPTAGEAVALDDLADRLRSTVERDATTLQGIVYQVGKDHDYANRLRDWFAVVYEVVFGSPEGPRLGGFIEVYGVEPFADLLTREPII
jgi:lysyl-tRNA synthetase class 1